eukprot:3869336-Alexandrium_andersonii.AAC.1
MEGEGEGKSKRECAALAVMGGDASDGDNKLLAPKSKAKAKEDARRNQCSQDYSKLSKVQVCAVANRLKDRPIWCAAYAQRKRNKNPCAFAHLD